MTNEIKYTFFKYDRAKMGIINCACIGKKPVYNYSEGMLLVYSLNYNSFKKIAVWKVKELNQESLSNTLNNEVESIAA